MSNCIVSMTIRQNCTTQGKGTVPLMVYIERLCKRGFVFQDSGIKQVYENGSGVDYLYIKGWEHLFWTKKKNEDTTVQLGK